jgi:hypothetical protein
MMLLVRPLGLCGLVANAAVVGFAFVGACAELASVDAWPGASATATSSGPGGATDDGGTVDGSGGSPTADAAGLYYDEVLASEPMAYWRFDESDGVQALDVSGNAAHAVYVGGVTVGVVGGVPGNTAVEVDGGQFIQTTLDNEVDFAQNASFSLECFIHAKLLDANYRQVINKQTATVDAKRNGYSLWVRNVDNLPIVTVELFNAAGDTYCSAPVDLPDRMVHLVATFENGQLLLYMDNVLEGFKTCMGDGFPQNDEQLRIGQIASGMGVDSFVGVIDEVAIYNRALSPDEIEKHHNAAKSAR